VCKPKVLYLPTPSHTKKVFTKETFQRLMEHFDVTLNEAEVNYTTEQVAQKVRRFEGLVTGWGNPPLTEKVFENADRLRIIAHSAGSVKWMLPEDVIRKYVIPRGICIFSANQAIAYNVAESTIGLLIMTSRRFLYHALAIREKGVWRDPSIPQNGQFLMGSTVGIVAASKVGREVIRLLKPFDVEILVCDPYLSEWEAERLGVRKADLDDLFSNCDFVTIHAPLTPETRGMIGARQLKHLKDGAVLVTTLRKDGGLQKF
jgi:phosphoglycerate dehydrogenase-like enzyme